MSETTLSEAINSLRKEDDAASEENISALVEIFGVQQVLDWRTSNKHQHSLLHEFTCLGKAKGVACLVKLGLDVNMQRPSDGCTALHLAGWFRSASVIDELVRLGARTDILNKYGEGAEKTLRARELMDYFCFLDLELTSLEGPSVLECAVSIADKDLNVVEQRDWVIHKKQEELAALSDWHQTTFASFSAGGNGLFDACLQSSTTAETFEKELLDLLKKYYPPKTGRLCGASVHCDKEAFGTAHPEVYAYLSHQVVDTSTLYQLMDRWAPAKRTKFHEGTENNSTENQHRARQDVDRDIKALKFYREHFLQLD